MSIFKKVLQQTVYSWISPSADKQNPNSECILALKILGFFVFILLFFIGL